MAQQQRQDALTDTAESEDQQTPVKVDPMTVDSFIHLVFQPDVSVSPIGNPQPIRADRQSHGAVGPDFVSLILNSAVKPRNPRNPRIREMRYAIRQEHPAGGARRCAEFSPGDCFYSRLFVIFALFAFQLLFLG
jgi:hypothetical protein